MNQSELDRIIVAGPTDDDEAANDGPQENPPPYLKLIADCWDYIFDYLSFGDIIVMSQTCKRMNQMVRHHICEYHPQLGYKLNVREIQLPYYPRSCVRPDFYQFISKLYIDSRSELEFFQNVDQNTFALLKTLSFSLSRLTVTQFRYTRNVFKNIETIQLMNCRISGNIFEQFANYCQNLKCLKVHNCDVKDADYNALFSQRYLTLEKLCWSHYNPKFVNARIGELKIFFAKHSSLQELEIHWRFILANRDVLNQTNIRLDRLIIRINGDIGQIIEFLKTLYARGFYKTLDLLSNVDASDAIVPNAGIEKTEAS